jgi:poly(3-hydroxybutyrate) depolymerase
MYKLTHTLYLALSLFLASLSLVQAARSAGCGKSPTLTSTTYTTQINGKSRQYILKLPNNYNSAQAYKLIFLWHQRGGSATKIVNGENPNQGGVLPYYGLPPFSNNSAIFVVPNGLDSGWANSNGEDITFYDAMVKAVEAGLCVDTSLRFSTGFSYGGAMSYAVACARGKDTRAVAVISGSLLSGCAGGNDPVAYYGQHGTSDSVLPTSGGRSIRDRFVKNNGCTAVAEPAPNGGKSVKTVYKNCKAGYPVTWVIHNGDHNPSQTDSGSSTPFAPANTWEFFSQFASV